MVEKRNVRILVNPNANATIEHFVSAQITSNEVVLGMPLGLEGFSGDVLGTEDSMPLTTEQPA